MLFAADSMARDAIRSHPGVGALDGRRVLGGSTVNQTDDVEFELSGCFVVVLVAGLMPGIGEIHVCHLGGIRNDQIIFFERNALDDVCRINQLLAHNGSGLTRSFPRHRVVGKPAEQQGS